MHSRIALICAPLLLVASQALAQLGLPQVSLPRLPVPEARGVFERTRDVTRDVRNIAEDLAEERLETLERLVDRSDEIIEFDAAGEPARRGEVLVMDAGAAAITQALARGYTVKSVATIEGLGIRVTTLAVPESTSLAEAQAQLARLMPGATLAADNLHFQSGSAGAAILPLVAARASTGAISVPVGMIDGAPGSAVPVSAVRGFAKGAPYPSNHGSAIASLLKAAGVGTVRVADVYGTDKAGGNALAIAKGLGWLVGQGSRVATISLVGPKNPVLARAIAAAQKKGVVVVAAVGNDGPAAPPAYPASYPGVVAVTAVDEDNRALIEAGRALHLDYAAPGADMRARNAKGKLIKLRGTSFATPLVAARLAAALGAGGGWKARLDREATNLGPNGADDTYGRGLLCGSCRELF